MTYIPVNQFIYTNAFSGALSATVLSDRTPTSDVPTDYTTQILIAQAFAQQLDTVAGAGGPPGQLPVIVSQLVAQLCAAAWQDRAPTSTDPLAYDALCKTILAIGSNVGAVVGPIPNLQANGQVLVDNSDTTFGFLAEKLAAGAGVTLTVLNPGANEQLQVNAAGGGGFVGVPFGTAYFDAAGVGTSVSDYIVVPAGVFGRPEVRDFRQNIPLGRGAIYKNGSWSQDGDAQNVMGEGYVSYGVSPTGLGPSALDGGMGYFTPNSFGCYTVINGVNGNNTFPTCAYGDGGPWDPFGVNGFIMRDNTAIQTVFLNRATGKGTFNAVQTGGATGGTWQSGAGSPEGVIVGSVGDLWTRTDGVPNDTLYVKESGNATNTGWTPVRQTLRGVVPAPFPIAAIGATQGFTVTVPGALPGMAVSASVDPTGGVGNQWVLFASSVTAPNLVDLQYVCLTGAVAPVTADINVAVSQ